ncbi:glycine--tRNA ligase subunit beta [Parasphingorhabdus cellanae]|uniref:Glycine--tRNA ligase beta subunit n=1 Tax=Parasphingorhabdus cellanae TaxID=2806553 RepID=A0ABX7T4E6_9SPHN|nr:glycine--tRNA ligase subunit beta [Parasphingorhabdus cellanae]QTD56401.1 glycine--tRNA ligase subunit beta [Parasphingorhabdus cellanae]
MADFLLELLSEEIPARMQAKARADLERLFAAQLNDEGLKAADITVYSTPRRLALIAKDLPDHTEAVSEEAKGPPEGAPDQAVDGFCRKNGVTRDQLEVRDVKGRATYFAVINKPGRAASDVLAEAIPAIIKAFPWPKSMRWGDASLSTESLRWVRPLSGIVAILGDDLVACEIDGVTSGYETVGHRFHHDGVVTIGNAGDYAEKLRACYVLVDHTEREAIIREGAAKAASDGGLELVADEGLVIENAGLTEWPVPLLGGFDPAFLDVPEEVIQLTARVNQKYFICRDKSGKLAPNFICTANIDATDGGKAIVAGNEKVLAARLSDAKFFWELDQKTPLEDHAKKLSNIVFHEKLGTVADKVERVAKLAEWLVSLEGNGFYQSSPGDTFHGEVSEAARLCKADLVTEMVGEFPDLQGLMGGYYAEKEGKSEAVANAIRDHYKPVGQGDEVPTDPVTVAVSLADKLDTLIAFDAVDLNPTGSKDPFAIRRQGLAALALMNRLNLRIPMKHVIEMVRGDIFVQQFTKFIKIDDNLFMSMITLGVQNEQLPEFKTRNDKFVVLVDGKVVGEMSLDRSAEFKQMKELTQRIHEAEDIRPVEFLAERLKVQQREAGVRHDLIDAVFALGGEDDLVRLLARVKALQAFVETPDGENLLAGYKRAANILKKESAPGADPEPRVEGATATLGSASSAEHGSVKTLPDSASGERGSGENRAPAQAGAHLPHDTSDAPPGDGPLPTQGNKTLSYTPEKAEKALIDALDAAQPDVTAAIAAEEFEKAMTALAHLRAPIDQFFEDVTVNDSDADKREARLALLARFRAAVHQVADFSKIEG